jgi:hypothetical protein
LSITTEALLAASANTPARFSHEIHLSDYIY